MKKDVYVDIIGKQSFEENEDVTEFYTKGTLYENEGHYYIIYDENKNIGEYDCITKLDFYKNKVILTRSINKQDKTYLVIEKGKRNVGNYNTNYGDLLVGITARNVDFDINETGGNISFQYSLDVNYELVSNHDVKINIREC